MSGLSLIYNRQLLLSLSANAIHLCTNASRRLFFAHKSISHQTAFSISWICDGVMGAVRTDLFFPSISVHRAVNSQSSKKRLSKPWERVARLRVPAPDDTTNILMPLSLCVVYPERGPGITVPSFAITERLSSRGSRTMNVGTETLGGGQR